MIKMVTRVKIQKKKKKKKKKKKIFKWQLLLDSLANFNPTV